MKHVLIIVAEYVKVTLTAFEFSPVKETFTCFLDVVMGHSRADFLIVLFAREEEFVPLFPVLGFTDVFCWFVEWISAKTLLYICT